MLITPHDGLIASREENPAKLSSAASLAVTSRDRCEVSRPRLACCRTKPGFSLLPLGLSPLLERVKERLGDLRPLRQLGHVAAAIQAAGVVQGLPEAEAGEG